MTNQHRCETCESNLKEKAEGDSIWCAKSEEWLVTRHAQRIINGLGCASHSNAKTIQCTVCGSDATHPHCDICFGLAMENHRQDEREKVLDELKAFCKEKGTNWAYDKWTMKKLIEYVELHSNEEET